MKPMDINPPMTRMPRRDKEKIFDLAAVAVGLGIVVALAKVAQLIALHFGWQP